MDVDVQDGFGGTPLTRAALGRRVEIVKYLVEEGASAVARQPHSHADDEESPDCNVLEYCATSGKLEVVKLILKHGEVSGVRVMAKAIGVAIRTGSDDVLRFVLDQAGLPPDATKEDEGESKGRL